VKPVIYFASALGRNREGSPLHEDIILMLKKFGTIHRERVSGHYKIVSPDDEAPTRLATEAELEAWRATPPKDKRSQELQLLASCTHLVAEVTLPSVQLGMLIANAANQGKHVLCLQNKQFGSAPDQSPMLSGDPRISCCVYETIPKLLPIFETFFSPASDSSERSAS
jgi:hypothetical protein